MNTATTYLENVCIVDQDLIETVTVTEAKHACHLAVIEALTQLKQTNPPTIEQLINRYKKYK